MNVLKEWNVGRHHFQWEEPDLLRCTFRGPTSVEDIEHFLSIMKEVSTGRRIFVISDISESTIEKDAREHLSQNIRPEWLHGLIYVGADALQRAIVKAIMIALYFTGKWKVDIQFAATEQEARAHVARERLNLGTGTAPGSGAGSPRAQA